jgi:hypothetical protein
MYVLYPSDRRRDSLVGEAGPEVDPFAHLRWVDSLSDSVRVVIADSLAGVIAPLRERIAKLHRHADSIMAVLYPPPPPEPEPVVEAAVADTLVLLPPETDTLARPGWTAPEAFSLSTTTDTLILSPAVDTLILSPPPDTLPVPVPPSMPEPEPEPEPERTEPPEVVDLRAKASRLTTRADSLASAENYIRPRTIGPDMGTGVLDSLARLRLDSISRADSLVRIDSIRIADPKAYKRLKKAEARRLKAQRQRLAAERREAKFAEKAAARLEKQRLRAEKRAAKAAEKAAAIAARRRSAGRRGYLPPADSLAVADSLARDSLRRLDSLPPLDSLAGLDSLPPRDSARRDTTMRIFRGWRNVKIWREDMQAVADSMVGFSVDSTLHMYRDPVMWHADSQITADSITLYTANEQIDHAEFFGNPIMGSQIGGPRSRQFNQVKGRTMTSWFRDGELHRHDTHGNAQAYYYMQEEEEQPDGTTAMSEALTFIVVTSDNMSFIFEADSLRYIVARQDVEDHVFPMDQIPPTQPTQIQGFVWRPERQPTLRDVFDRTVRPTEREFYEGLARPEVPVAARIDRRREYLIQNRMWADRTDPLPAYAVEFREKYQPPPVQPQQ